MKSRHVTKNMTGREREMARKEKLVLVILLYGAAVISRHQYMSDMISRIYANDQIYMFPIAESESPLFHCRSL